MLPAQPSVPCRRLLVSVDMQRYSQRDNIAQHRAQQVFHSVMADAVRTVGLDRSGWKTQPGGDSELAILPVDTPEPTVVGALASCLDRILRQENRHLLPQAKVRLRMAVHEGLVHLDSANGYAGDAVNTVCRLRDAGCLKQALAVFQDAALALIVSEPIYREVVAQRYDGIRDNRFRRIFIDDEEKQFRSEAWMCVVDEDVTAVDLQVTPQPGLLGPDSTTTPPRPVPQPAAGKYSFGAIHSSGAMAVGDNSSAINDARPGGNR